MIIEIEGCDGVGKTTVAKLLAEKIGAQYLKFPDRTTPTGKVIDTMLRGGGWLGEKTYLDMEPTTYQALNVVNRLEHFGTLDRCHQNQALHLVCDRYIQSAFVYGGQDNVNPEWLADLMLCFPPPDLHVLLWVDPETLDAERLAGRDREVYESRGVKGLVSQSIRFMQIWAQHESDPRWVKYNSNERSANTIAEMVISDLDYIKGGM
jgi:dTMP kinase